jgi:hypothetical protein
MVLAIAELGVSNMISRVGFLRLVIALLATFSLARLVEAQEQSVEEPINAREWLNAAWLLLLAKDYVENYALSKGPVVPIPENFTATALEESFKDTKLSVVDFNYAHEALSRAIGVPREPLGIDPKLDVPYWGEQLMVWNDAKGRKLEDVLKAFEDAAKIASDLRGAALRKPQ